MKAISLKNYLSELHCHVNVNPDQLSSVPSSCCLPVSRLQLAASIPSTRRKVWFSPGFLFHHATVFAIQTQKNMKH
jgi:hypothetical protein